MFSTSPKKASRWKVPIRICPWQSRVSTDERVGVAWLGWTCGTCRYCRSGRENLCDRARFTGYTLDGGYAEEAVADERYCLPLPDNPSDEQIAPLPAGQDVVAGPSDQRVVANASEQGVIAVPAPQIIIFEIAAQPVVEGGSGKPLDA